jgi:protein-S-isoprenylcysteine O-methyltransferase Ste14
MIVMALQEQMQAQGGFLFRWRSYFPIAVFIPLAIASTQMTWPFGSHFLHNVWAGFCLLVSLTGLLIRALVVGQTPRGTSGRNTAYQVAEQLNTTGIYATVRHPLYLGNYLIALGPMLLPMNVWLPAVFSLAFVLYYERIIIAEENFLRSKFRESFDQWANVTPVIIPRLTNWTKPSLPFSLRNVLRREYTALAQITVTFFCVEVGGHLAIDRQFVVEPIWLAIVGIGVFQYVLFRFLKRHTQVLSVQGR